MPESAQVLTRVGELDDSTLPLFEPLPPPTNGTLPSAVQPQAPGPSSRLNRRTSWSSRFTKLVRTNWLIAVLLVMAAILRFAVSMTYRPALIFSDSLDFLHQAGDLKPSAWHPLGYPLVLAALTWMHNLAVYAALNHLMGLTMGILLYALLLRLGVRRWLAAIAVVPILFDAYQLITEQYILSDALYQLLIVVAFTIMMWRKPDGQWRQPSFGRCVAIGLLFTAAAITRFDGAIIILPAIAFLAVRRIGWRKVGVVLAAFLLPIVGYASWYDAVNGEFTTSGLTGLFLYARVAPFADCKGLTLPSYEQRLCPTLPVNDRRRDNWWAASPKSPGVSQKGHDGMSANDVLLDFDQRIIEHQPWQYASAVFEDYIYQFSPTHSEGHNVSDVQPWQFSKKTPGTGYIGNPAAVAHKYSAQNQFVNTGLAQNLRDYQLVFYTPGPLIAVALGLSLVAVVWRRRTRGSGIRAECAAFAAGGVLTFLFAAATAGFDWRYQLPSLVTVPIAGVLAITMLSRPVAVPSRYRHSARSAGIQPSPTASSVALAPIVPPMPVIAEDTLPHDPPVTPPITRPTLTPQDFNELTFGRK